MKGTFFPLTTMERDILPTDHHRKGHSSYWPPMKGTFFPLTTMERDILPLTTMERDILPSVMPVNAHQCNLPVPPHQCPSVPPISVHQCSLSVPITTASLAHMNLH
ncbi:unnamed protein product [Staurois parvus]|uniref:Uncharacterized protein n=1 Tax=Staurois parvus TaxID=386267 RepID=A0ABN9BEL1_9NEOB|nr:unnamed protein product [Staurois parvus]